MSRQLYGIETSKSGIEQLLEARGKLFDQVVVIHLYNWGMQLINELRLIDDRIYFTDWL